eukprot:m.1179680 g.1179680  ORF g.1179680 m.1179680 type:complete len:955 (+) comp24529_c0_seq57:140-3004(+)
MIEHIQTSMACHIGPHFCRMMLILALFTAPVCHCSGFESSEGATRPTVAPKFVVNIRINRQSVSSSVPFWIDPDTPTVVHWHVSCACGTCTQSQCCHGYTSSTTVPPSISVQHTSSTGTVLSDVHPRHNETHYTVAAGSLASDTLYAVTVSAPWMIPTSSQSGRASYTVYVRTALKSQDWGGAEWIGGGTLLRGQFHLPPEPLIRSASAFVSGVGCAELTVNGKKPDNTSFLNPGWAVLPTVRNVYRAYDVATMLVPGNNVLGIRLGMCKYGYQGAFCEGAGGATAQCRGAVLRVQVHFADNTTLNVSTSAASGMWETTTSSNQIVYDHLYNGEIRDDRLGDPLWDTPARADNGSWTPAVPFHNAAHLGKLLTLLPMAPVAATLATPPVSITKITPAAPALCTGTGDTLVAQVAAGQHATLQCAHPIDTITDIVFASYGSPPRLGGRFIGGNVASKCADPAYPPGCIFWEDYANHSKHFVSECTVAPCNVDACGAFTPVGANITALATGPPANCTYFTPVPCSTARPGACDAADARAVMTQTCVGRNTCIVNATPSLFNHTCSGIPGAELFVAAAGCAPKAEAAATYVFDFGMNQAGFARLRVTGAAGTTLTLKYAEVLNADGTVKMDWCGGKEGHACVCTGINCANQTDAFTLRGDPLGEVYTPTFTYHGFRYVQVEGWPGPGEPTADALTALFVHSVLPATGSVHFNASALQVLNGIQRAYVYTQLSNVHGHPTDCPTREKRGWTGDSQLTAGGAVLNFDAAAFYGNWLTTMRDHQAVNCAPANTPPAFPQANVDVCCDPPDNGFGCDYTGLPGGRFNETSGALADVIPFTHVGGWCVAFQCTLHPLLLHAGWVCSCTVCRHCTAALSVRVPQSPALCSASIADASVCVWCTHDVEAAACCRDMCAGLSAAGPGTQRGWWWVPWCRGKWPSKLVTLPLRWSITPQQKRSWTS